MTFEELLARDGRIAYTCKGSSMLPLLREGRDVMIIERRDAYRRLDAVLFKRPGEEGRGDYVLHRILRVDPDGSFWIVGDNCVTGETVPADCILGVMTAVVRDGKKQDDSSLGYRVYLNTWCRCYRLRFTVLRAKRFIGRMLRRLT